MIPKLHFSRFEFKYVLPAALRKEVESELAHFVELDPYVGDRPGQRYFVRSLYYDDPPYSNYFEKIDGMMTRAKFRLRTYTADPEEVCPTFLEIKGRHGGLVFKHRTLVTELPHLLNGAGYTGALVRRHTEKGPVADRFEYEVGRKRLRPCMLIDYQRRPYVSRYAPEFRLTFDEQLRGTHTSLLHPSRDVSRRLLPGHTVLEVKFRYHVPSWFHRIIQSYELRRVSISKYCKGMEAFGLVPHLE